MAARAQATVWFLYGVAAFMFVATYFRYSVLSEYIIRDPAAQMLTPPTDGSDQYKCSAALSTGVWLDDPSSSRSTSPFKKWQPQGCMLRNYNSKGVSTCLGGERGQGAAFVGDSTVREVFWATARKLNSTVAKAQELKAEKHKDITFQDGKTILSFVWDPTLKSTQLLHYLETSRDNAADHTDRLELPNSKTLLVVGGGLWFAKEAKNPVEDFKHAMDKIALPQEPPYHHGVNAFPGTNRAVFLPVQPPLYDSLDTEHKSSMHKADIDAMNKYMRELPAVYGVNVLLSVLDMVDNQPEAYQENGLHVINTVADRQAEILLNYACSQAYEEYPYVGTCCYSYPLGWDSTIIWTVGLIGLAALAWFELQSKLSPRTGMQIATTSKY